MASRSQRRSSSAKASIDFRRRSPSSVPRLTRYVAWTLADAPSPLRAASARKRETSTASSALAAHMRLERVKIWIASAASASPRANASARPPAVDSCAPRSKGELRVRLRPLFADDPLAGHLVVARDEVLERIVQRIVHRIEDHVPELRGGQAQALVVLLAVDAVHDDGHVARADEDEVHHHPTDLPGEVREGEDLHEAVVRMRRLLDGVQTAELVACHEVEELLETGLDEDGLHDVVEIGAMQRHVAAERDRQPIREPLVEDFEDAFHQ